VILNGGWTRNEANDPAGSPAGGDLRPTELSRLPATPLVSVLVSCYNYVEFLDECIESVVGQSYRHFELIVSDDGSTDGSGKAVARWASADPRVRLVSGPHRGMGAALNAAWKESRGQIICLLDADDTFLADKIESVVVAFQANPQVGYVVHRAFRTDAQGRRRGALPLLKSGPSGWCASWVLRNGGVLPDVPPTSNLSIRREIGEKIFPLPSDFRGYAELVIQRLAPLFTNVFSLDQALATWRLHGANDSNAPQIGDQLSEREIAIIENLWHIQRRYLETVSAEAAAALQPVTCSDYYCRLRYALARRRSSPDAALLHRQLLSSPGFGNRPMLDRCFWRIAPWLPAGVMNRIFNLVMTQNWGKELITRIRRIGA
jgi:glycosyltransferase involved in cell wall biosynthesis